MHCFLKAAPVYLWFLTLLVVNGRFASAVPDGDHKETEVAETNAFTLTSEEESILHSLGLANLLKQVEAGGEVVSMSQVEEFLRLVSLGTHDNHLAEGALEGSVKNFLFLSPSLIVNEFGNGEELSRSEFKFSVSAILSCLVHQNCALSTDIDFIHEDHEEHEEGHNSEDANEDHLQSHDDDKDRMEENEDDEDESALKIKVIALVILFLESIVGSMVPIVLGTFSGFDHLLSSLNCFAGGTLLATGLIHLISHVVEFQQSVDTIGEYPVGLLVVVLSFTLVFYLEHVLVDVHFHTEDASPGAPADSTKNEIGPWIHLHDLRQSILLLAATAVHSVLEALVLGIQNDSYTVWLLFASIAGHKGVTAMALSARFTKAYVTTKQALGLSFLFSLTAPIAVLIGTGLSDVPALTGLILTSMSTGTFIYIGAYEVISEEFRGHPPTNDGKDDVSPFLRRHTKFLSLLSGVLLIAILAFVPHADGSEDHGHGSN